MGRRTPAPISHLGHSTLLPQRLVIPTAGPFSDRPTRSSSGRSSKPVGTAPRSATAAGTRPAAQQGARSGEGSAPVGGLPAPIPTRAWPARQAGFDTIQPRVNKMSPAQNLVRFRLSAGATKAGTRNCRLWLHPGWRRDLREDLAVVRWNLHRQEVALAAASRFCDQLRARERVGGSVPLRCAKQKLKLDYNIPTVIAQYLAKYKKIEN